MEYSAGDPITLIMIILIIKHPKLEQHQWRRTKLISYHAYIHRILFHRRKLKIDSDRKRVTDGNLGLKLKTKKDNFKQSTSLSISPGIKRRKKKNCANNFKNLPSVHCRPEDRHHFIVR